MAKKEWFENWFDSKYYHLLYNHRNYAEANFFIEHLCKTLKLKEGDRIWDMACGKGRHAIALSKKGFDVTGSDISVNSIKSASEHESKHLNFKVHDMREPLKQDHFKAAVNLFTSFGYFSDEKDNFRVFDAVYRSLENGGSFVLDFFYASKLRSMEESAYQEIRGDIVFQIKKSIKSGAIKKEIEFRHEGKSYHFEESVSLIGLADFEKYASGSGLKISKLFGSYHLEPFDEQNSDRLILIFKK